MKQFYVCAGGPDRVFGAPLPKIADELIKVQKHGAAGD